MTPGMWQWCCCNSNIIAIVAVNANDDNTLELCGIGGDGSLAFVVVDTDFFNGDISPGNFYYTVVEDSTGKLHLGYIGNVSNSLRYAVTTVASYDPDDWVFNKENAAVSEMVTYPDAQTLSFNLDKNDKPSFVYCKTPSTSKICYLSKASGAWSKIEYDVGSIINGMSPHCYDSSNNMYVAAAVDGPGGQFFMYKYDGSSWTSQIINTSPRYSVWPLNDSYICDIGISNTGVIYVSEVAPSLSTTFIYQYSGGAWSLLGGSTNKGVNFAIDTTGRLFVKNYITPSHASIRELDGTWTIPHDMEDVSISQVACRSNAGYFADGIVKYVEYYDGLWHLIEPVHYRALYDCHSFKNHALLIPGGRNKNQ